jgi:hypothetical protein
VANSAGGNCPSDEALEHTEVDGVESLDVHAALAGGQGVQEPQ